MGYFRELPNLLYPSFLPNKKSSLDYIRVKNVFRRVKVRDDLYANFTVFQKYEIPEGARPDNVSEELFGTPNLDWVVLTVAGIINVRNEWPLSNHDLYNYVENNFTIPNPTNPSATLNPVVGISNFVYETRLNEEKRNINVLREEYLSEFLDDMRNLMIYNKSSESVGNRLIRAENTNITLP